MNIIKSLVFKIWELIERCSKKGLENKYVYVEHSTPTSFEPEEYYDMGEGMCMHCTSYNGRELLNKQTGKSLQLVDDKGMLALPDSDIDWQKIEQACPHCHHSRFVQYGFCRYSDFEQGVCALCWTIYPDGRYFADDDGYGSEDNDEEVVYCIINKDLEIVVPFQPMIDVKMRLKEVIDNLEKQQ